MSYQAQSDSAHATARTALSKSKEGLRAVTLSKEEAETAFHQELLNVEIVKEVRRVRLFCFPVLFSCLVPLFCPPVLFPPCLVSLFCPPVLYSRLEFHSFPLFLLPHVQAFATETEVHRRARVVAEAEKKALDGFVVLMNKQLSKTRAGYKQLTADLKTAVEEAERTKDALDKAIAAGTADAQNAKSDFNEHRLYQEDRRSDGASKGQVTSQHPFF